MVNNRVIANRLEDIAGKARNIPEAVSCSPSPAGWA